MARHPRLVTPGVALHIVQRGNNRHACFHQDSDRLVYLTVLRDLARLRRCALHAYCLMTNHIHLFLTPHDETSSSLLMRDLARCYASYFNRRYSRTGTLWEGPFRSCLVDSATYVLGCYRYIELNPVRANVVRSPSGYAWSSYAGNVGMRADSLLTPHPEYLALGHEDESRWRAYAQLCDASDDGQLVSAVRDATMTGFPLLGEQLKAQLEAQGARLQPGKRGPSMSATTDDAPTSLELHLTTR